MTGIPACPDTGPVSRGKKRRFSIYHLAFFIFHRHRKNSMQAYREKLGDRSLPSTERSVEVDESLERLSWLMDDLIKIPGLGWRFGLDALVGLIPGLGDTATSLAAFYILASAVRYGVPKVTILRMGVNIGIDYLVGSLPLVGDLFDAWWKSNHMNLD